MRFEVLDLTVERNGPPTPTLPHEGGGGRLGDEGAFAAAGGIEYLGKGERAGFIRVAGGGRLSLAMARGAAVRPEYSGIGGAA